jgi:hypothetical protein
MLNSGGKLRAQTATGTLTFPVEPSQEPYDDPDVDRLLNDLQSIERQFGVVLVIPDTISEEDDRLIRFLGTGIRDHRVSTSEGELSITLSPSADDGAVQALGSGKDLSVDTDADFVVFGCSLPRIRYKTTFVSPTLVEPTLEEVRRRLREGQEVAVRFSVATIVHTFAVWEARAA